MKFFSVYLSFISLLSPVEMIVQADVEPALPSRPISFMNPPRLLKTSTTSNNINAPALYFLTIAHPPDAREPIQKITIQQVSGGQSIQFNLRRTQVYEGRREQQNTLLPSQMTAKRNTLTISLTPPISPGTIFTVVLNPVRNPDSEGTYFFGVTAFPLGANVDSQFLGFGRFQFQRSTGVE